MGERLSLSLSLSLSLLTPSSGDEVLHPEQDGFL